jgi:hypothetical protein
MNVAYVAMGIRNINRILERNTFDKRHLEDQE